MKHADWSDHLSDLFTIMFNGYAYTWLTTPMGWSFSPSISQTFSWYIVLHREEGDEAFFDDIEIRTEEGLPSHVRIRNATGTMIGFACITYDNIGVFVRRQLHRRKNSSTYRKELQLVQCENKGRFYEVGYSKADGGERSRAIASRVSWPLLRCQDIIGTTSFVVED